jgi:hypothetical protein
MPFEEGSRLVSGGKSTSNIFRARRSFQDNSFVAAMVTDRRLDEGGSGSLVGLDGALRISTKYMVSWQALMSQTTESDAPDLSLTSGLNGVTFDRGNHTAALDGERFSGHALSSKLDRNGRNYGFSVGFEQLSPTFRTDNGFVTNNDARRFNVMNRYSFYITDNAWINRLTVFAGVNRFWNFDNVRKDESVFAGFNAQLSHQTRIDVNAFASNELYAGHRFTKLNRINIRLNSNFREGIQLGFNSQYGNAIYRNPEAPEIGVMLSGNANLSIRTTERMTIGSSLSFSQLKQKQSKDTFYSGYILRSRMDYQFTRKLMTRVIAQYNEFSGRLELDPLVTYRVSPFTVFHFGSSHRYEDFPAARDGQPMVFQQTNRQIFFKLQYLFRM